MTCPLCQYRFNDRGACHTCGLVTGCTLIKCPNCGYEFVEQSKTLSLLTRIYEYLRRKKR